MANEADSHTCVVVGGGPAGAMLSLLLARAGIDVALLERHKDFLRDWRGDTIHPSTMEVLAEIGLIDQFFQLPHSRSETVRVYTDTNDIGIDLRNTGLRYPFVVWVPQWDFLEMITAEARRYPSFRLLMCSDVHDVIREDGRVTGVRYRDADGARRELRGRLTVAADGRNSTVRGAAGLVPKEVGAPMDILGFRVSRTRDDPAETFLRIARGRTLTLINRNTYWQIGYLIPKGSFDDLKRKGIGELQRSVSDLLPFLKDRMAEVSGWDKAIMLDVRVNRLERWHQPGLLLIGDAAHAMSPTGAVGINLAVQDAVASANVLAEPLRAVAEGGGPLDESLLAAVQRRRESPTIRTQRIANFLDMSVVGPTLRQVSNKPVSGPLRLRLVRRVPMFRRFAGRTFGVGFRQEHVRLLRHVIPGEQSP